MSEHIDLPEGHSAELRDVAKITERQRKPAKMAMMAAAEANTAAMPEVEDIPQPVVVDGVPQPPAPAKAAPAKVSLHAFELMEDALKLLIVALVESWSYPVEISVDSLEDLPGDAFSVLYRIAQDNINRVMPDFTPTASRDTPTLPSSV